MTEARRPIPITVIGGYLGAGKTTLLNRLLADPGGRRLGVIVNDFGSLGIDAALLAGRTGTGADRDVVSLPNGCICCALGSDLHEALTLLAERDDPPDQIVIETSGVADPAVAAAWGTSAGFEPGGVIVLVAVDAVRRLLGDRYVGGEVRRQIAGADLLVLTKTDVCDDATVDVVHTLLVGIAPDVPRLVAPHGDLPPDVVLGTRPVGGPMATTGAGEPPTGRDAVDDGEPSGVHVDRYVTWSWSGGTVAAEALRSLLDDPPDGLLRLKGIVATDAGERLEVQLVGRTADTRHLRDDTPDGTGSRVVAIGVRDVLRENPLGGLHPPSR